MLLTFLLILSATTVAYFIFIYNRFVRLQNQLKEGWSGIDVQLKRRFDLVPNLVEAVKGYAAHEKALFENISKARTWAQSATDPSGRQDTENGLTRQLRQLFAVAEAYPQLKANENFLELQKSLVAVEDEMQMARRYYNGCVRNWNVAIESFPSNIVGNIFKFQSAAFFEIETTTQREAPELHL